MVFTDHSIGYYATVILNPDGTTIQLRKELSSPISGGEISESIADLLASNPESVVNIGAWSAIIPVVELS